MNEQRGREIAEVAFKAHFGAVRVVRVNVRRGFDYDKDDPMVDVNIIYDGKYEQLSGHGLLDVQSDNRLEGVVGRGGLAWLPAGTFHRQVRHRAARPGDGLTPCPC